MSFQSIAWQLMSEEDYAAYIEEKVTMPETITTLTITTTPENADYILQLLDDWIEDTSEDVAINVHRADEERS